jgi:peptidyl-prolyl cis-trans isomerase B (cyclophilin B)
MKVFTKFHNTRIIVATAVLIISCFVASTVFADTAPKVRIQTNMGTIVLELNQEKAPMSVANFLQYVNDGFYNGTIFHRVIDGFMIQGGGFTQNLEKKDTRPPVKNEANNGLKNERGTIAMARTNDPHSATAQFFINVVNNDFLDYRSSDPRGWGYAVFGKVVEGIDIVDKIKAVPTGASGPFGRDVPITPVVIESATLIEAAPTPAAPSM